MTSVRSSLRRLTFLLVLAWATGPAIGAAAPPALHPPPPVDFHHLPWTDGEALTYLVSWATLKAAEGTFTAHDKGSHWEFDLDLASRGVVDSFYPFTGNFWCILAKSPWRSTEYGEYRFEPKRVIRERTRIDYAQRRGVREIWSEGKTKTFSLAENAVDDIGTLLYHLRASPWKPGDKRTYHVYESDSEKEAEAECQDRESRAFGNWPLQPVVRILVLPTKGTHRRGHLLLWMTDDARRLPLHAELAFRYGTFNVDLETASIGGKTFPAGP